MSDDRSMQTLQPDLKECGWAVKLNGMLQLRTASTRIPNVMANGLCLIYGLPWHDLPETDEGVEQLWEFSKQQIPEHNVEIVKVICVESDWES